MPSYTAPPVKIYLYSTEGTSDSALPISLLPYIWRVLYRRQPLRGYLLSVATGKSHAGAANGRY